jgi:hypothetical protein
MRGANPRPRPREPEADHARHATPRRRWGWGRRRWWWRRRRRRGRRRRGRRTCGRHSRVVDVGLGRCPDVRPCVSPCDVRSAEAVEIESHPVAEEAGFQRVERGRQVRHRGRRHPGVGIRRLIGGRVEDLRGRDVVAPRRLTRSERPVVEGDPQLASVAGDCAPRLPLSRLAETGIRPRRDVPRLAPRFALVRRHRVEDVVVAGGARGRCVPGSPAGGCSPENLRSDREYDKGCPKAALVACVLRLTERHARRRRPPSLPAHRRS